MKFMRTIPAVLASGLAAPGGLAHTDDHAAHGAPPERLGEVHFPVSCSDPAQQEFDRAMALFHSFWFRPAWEPFAVVLELDPSCAMAHWGTALVTLANPFGWPVSAQAQDAAADVLERARRSGPQWSRARAHRSAGRLSRSTRPAVTPGAGAGIRTRNVPGGSGSSRGNRGSGPACTGTQCGRRAD